MATFVGKLVCEPTPQNGVQIFRLWDEQRHKGVNCIAKSDLEFESSHVAFPYRAGDELEVEGNLNERGMVMDVESVRLVE